MESHVFGGGLNLNSHHELKYNIVKFYQTSVFSTLNKTLIGISQNYTDYFPDSQKLTFLSESQSIYVYITWEIVKYIF